MAIGETKSEFDKALEGVGGQAPTRESQSQEYRVKIPVFEGPLDLLLHLIRKEQVNIYDIPVAKICQSYLNYLEMMRQLDINLAGEFMSMASTLIYLKSVMLLPKDESIEDENDPRMPLVQQLLEYERFKKAANDLNRIPWLYRDIYPRPALALQDAIPVESLADAPLEPVDIYQLLLCLRAATQRTNRPPIQIQTDQVSIRDKVAQLTVYLESKEILDFIALLPDAPKSSDIIVSFLAVLELARLKFLEILQHEAFGPIQIRQTRALTELNQSMLQQY